MVLGPVLDGGAIRKYSTTKCYYQIHRMRNATLLIVNLKGVATETIKNIVLAGIGKLIILDGENVKPEDLGAGFFLRDEDVGRKVSAGVSHSVWHRQEKLWIRKARVRKSETGPSL